jgi:hypothetical protein
MHKDLSDLSIHEAFAAGDVNGDFRNDYADFQLFKTVFDELNGAGAFAAALAVPEPTMLGMMTLAALCGVICRSSRRGCVGARVKGLAEDSIELIAP